MAVIVGGFYFTLLSTAGSVVGVERFGKLDVVNGATNTSKIDTSKPLDIVTPNIFPPPPEPKPFSDELMKFLRITAIFSGLFALEGASPAFTSAPAKFLTKFQVPFLSLHLGVVTLASFCYGARLPKKFTRAVHPLVVCTSLTWAVMKLFSKCVEGGSFTDMLKAFKMGNGFNGLFGTGAGDVLLFLLGPAVVSLAISMYEKRQLIKDNAKEVAAGVAVSSVGGLFGTAILVRLAQIAQPSLRTALLSRNITSPLAMAIAGILGANSSTISLAVSMVVVTGLIGANFGASILSSFGINNPVARGMGIGAAAHGLGTAAFVNEKDAFPFAAISMVSV
jgi:putative effector of murein hydrolase